MLVCGLNELPAGCGGWVFGFDGSGSLRRRLQDIGLVEGTRVECVRTSPLGDPSAYFIRGAVIALRREDAKTVLIRC